MVRRLGPRGLRIQRVRQMAEPDPPFGAARLPLGFDWPVSQSASRAVPAIASLYFRPQETSTMAVATSAQTDLTDEQQAITEMVRQFADEQILPNAEHYDHEDAFPEPIVEQMKELGLFGDHDPRGVRRPRPGPDDLHDGRRGALARLDLDLRDHQHPLHRQLPAHEVRHRRAEAEVPPADGHRRDPRRLQPLRARARLRRAGDQDRRQEARRRRLRDQRPEDVGHQRPALRASSSPWSRPTRPPTRATAA